MHLNETGPYEVCVGIPHDVRVLVDGSGDEITPAALSGGSYVWLLPVSKSPRVESRGTQAGTKLDWLAVACA